MKKYHVNIVAVLVALVLATGCKQQVYNSPFNNALVFAKTVKELNNVVKQNNFPPIIASRNYAYAAIAAYETIVLGDNRFVSLAGQVKGLTSLVPQPQLHPDYRYAALLAYCKVGQAVTFPEGSMKYYLAGLQAEADKAGMTDAMQSDSKTLADLVADHIMTWSKTDKYAQTRTAEKYSITAEEGRWVPTPPAYIEAMEPNWNKIRPMVMDSCNQFIPPRPPKFGVTDKSSKFYKEVMLVKNAGDSLTDEQKHIAMFWDDLGSKTIVEGHVMSTAKKFTPTGHWMNIVGIAAQKAGVDFSTTVYAYTKTAIAMFDAFIQCWDEKFRSNLIRPETVINKYIDPDWTPFLQTPPFPEYTCGHSTVSAAAAEALTNVFGDNFAYTDTSEIEFGIKNRSFTSFRQAAIENNWARFYGGIHYHNSCIISTEFGKKVGNLVNDKLHMKK